MNAMITAMNISGASWDENTKTVALDEVTYKNWELRDKKSARHKEYVNKPLKHLEDLRLIIGDESATGSFCKSVWENIDTMQSQTHQR